MKVIIKFTKESPYYKAGQKQQVVNNLTEVHYCYKSSLDPSTAFESDIDGTGFTVQNKYIKDFEVSPSEECSHRYCYTRSEGKCVIDEHIKPTKEPKQCEHESCGVTVTMQKDQCLKCTPVEPKQTIEKLDENWRDMAIGGKTLIQIMVDKINELVKAHNAQ
ncbi:hypothetical protein LCGC14_2748740 [marine sediment metagenome]|uniref:Uncharacterized protein n=1 Tax=marine sediment metagenome TaxID=412755 RepID=A0A0F9BU42_9ZZZZ